MITSIASISAAAAAGYLAVADHRSHAVAEAGSSAAVRSLAAVGIPADLVEAYIHPVAVADTPADLEDLARIRPVHRIAAALHSLLGVLAASLHQTWPAFRPWNRSLDRLHRELA